MTSQIVKYHPTNDCVALLCDKENSQYWIGEYDPWLTHTTLEPPYTWLSGTWDNLTEAEISLALWI